MVALDDWDPGRMMDGSYGGGMMDDGTGLVVMLLGLLFLVLVIGVAAYWVVSATGARTAPRTDAPPVSLSARELLDRRLAGGELTPEEYDARRQLLDH